MPDVPMPDIDLEQSRNAYLFYDGAWQLNDVANLDKVFNYIGSLLSKGEAAINKELTDLSKIDPGQLDQSRLLQAQVNLSRWQLASQLLSNFASGIASGLKNTIQNVGR